MRWLFFIVLFANLGVFAWQLRPQETALAGLDSAPQNTGLGSLILLGEQQGQTPKTTTSTFTGGASSTVTEVASGATAKTTECYTLGPFKSEDLFEQARSELAGLGLQSSRRERKEREQYGYQVYLPAFPNRQAAIQAARNLATKGVREYYVMTEAGFENAVSLGLFRDKRHADQHIADLRSKGITPEMISRYRELTLYWLDYVDAEQQLSSDEIRALFGSETVQRLPRDCD